MFKKRCSLRSALSGAVTGTFVCNKRCSTYKKIELCSTLDVYYYYLGEIL